MADNISPWDSAFPNECTQEHGLSKREYFAAMALQGILANPATKDSDPSKDIAIDAVMLADRLIEQLNDIPPA
jgi:hypothetical protein